MIPFYECKHCSKKLTTQVRLDKHSCEQKKRYDIMQTVSGKSAFYCYKEWMVSQGRYVANSTVFRNSKYFHTFIRFNEFCKSMGLPDRKFFIQLMVSRQLAPVVWCDVEMYKFFIEEFDREKTPKQLAALTVETLFDLSRVYECDVSEVFDHIEVTDLAKLVHYRKLSPWVLLFSSKFHDYLKKSTPDQRILLNTVVDPKRWVTLFEEHPEEVERMKIYVRGLGL